MACGVGGDGQRATCFAALLWCLPQVLSITLSSIQTCEEFKGQYLKYDYLWKQDLQETLQDFLEANGNKHGDGSKEDPPLSKFEEQIQKYK